VTFKYKYAGISYNKHKDPLMVFKITGVREPSEHGIGDGDYEVSGALAIDEDGRIWLLRHSLSVPDEGYTDKYEYRLMETGQVTVDRPPWYDTAVETAEQRDDPDGPQSEPEP